MTVSGSGIGTSVANSANNAITVSPGQVIAKVRWRFATVATGSGSADFEHVADLPLAAWRRLAASLGTISTRRRVSSLRLIVITVIPRHLDKPQANRGA